MRYSYLILPPRPDPLLVRVLGALRALFRHPALALMVGLALLFLATRLNAQQTAPQGGERAALKPRIRAVGFRVPSAALMARILELKGETDRPR